MNIFDIILYKIYSLFFCLRYLPFKQAIIIPVLIHPCVRVKIKRGGVVLSGHIRRSMVSIGFECAKGRSNCKSLLCVNPKNDSKLYLNNGVIIAKGTRIIVDNGLMEIGNNFFCNGDCSFYCNTSISIGNNNMYGWDIHFNTTDGHPFYIDGKQVSMSDEIRIGDHVWIGSNTKISKGTDLASECVVAQCSLVNGRFHEEHCLIGGIPAKVIKENVYWTKR